MAENVLESLTERIIRMQEDMQIQYASKQEWLLVTSKFLHLF